MVGKQTSQMKQSPKIVKKALFKPLVGQQNQEGCVKPTSKKGNGGAVTQDDLYSGENLGEQLAKQASNQTMKNVLKSMC
jgi:hypothetical protein